MIALDTSPCRSPMRAWRFWASSAASSRARRRARQPLHGGSREGDPRRVPDRPSLEWVRGSGLVDFGWLTPAYALLDTPWAGFAPVFGAEGSGSAFFSPQGLSPPVWAGSSPSGTSIPCGGAASFAAALLTVLVGWGLTVVPWYEPASPVPYRMIQANQPVADLFTGSTRSRESKRSARFCAASHRCGRACPS